MQRLIYKTIKIDVDRSTGGRMLNMGSCIKNPGRCSNKGKNNALTNLILYIKHKPNIKGIIYLLDLNISFITVFPLRRMQR